MLDFVGDMCQRLQEEGVESLDEQDISLILEIGEQSGIPFDHDDMSMYCDHILKVIGRAQKSTEKQHKSRECDPSLKKCDDTSLQVINPLNQKVIFAKFLEFADYPEIVRYCIAHPPTCKDRWAKNLILEKRAKFLNFIYRLPKQELELYCKERSDVCKIKMVKNALNATNFQILPDRKYNMTYSDFFQMKDGDEIEVIMIGNYPNYRARIFNHKQDILNSANGLRVVSPLTFFRAIEVICGIRMVDRSNGIVQVREDDQWEMISIDDMLNMNIQVCIPMSSLHMLPLVRLEGSL